jgi:transposase
VAEVGPFERFDSPRQLMGFLGLTPSESSSGGKRAAAIMSLIATAKANGIEPHAWLTDVLTRLPTTKQHDIDTLLPLAPSP